MTINRYYFHQKSVSFFPLAWYCVFVLCLFTKIENNIIANDDVGEKQYRGSLTIRNWKKSDKAPSVDTLRITVGMYTLAKVKDIIERIENAPEQTHFEYLLGYCPDKENYDLIFKSLRGCSKLSQIDLLFAEYDNEIFGKIPDAKHLSIGYNDPCYIEYPPLTSQNLSDLGKMKSLVELTIYRALMDDWTPFASLHQKEQIERLELPGIEFEEPEKGLSVFHDYRKLKHLTVPVSIEDTKALQALREHQSLESLQVGFIDKELPEFLKSFPKLKKIGIHRKQTRFNGPEADPAKIVDMISRLKAVPNLEEITLTVDRSDETKKIVDDISKTLGIPVYRYVKVSTMLDKYALVRDTDKSKSVFTISDLKEAKKIGGLEELYVFMKIDPEQLVFLKERPDFRFLDLTYAFENGAYTKEVLNHFMEVIPNNTTIRFVDN